MSLQPGTRLGPYEILAPLGAGGMGEVYRATDSKLRREVAIKVLPAAFGEDPERLARFEREAQVLASLNHPNIAAIYGLEEGQGIRALVMELVEGDDLSALIARGPLPVSEALPIARQIAEALEAAHEQGIVHRDLKPANIKVRADGAVKVLDFGLAKAMDPAGISAADPANSPTLTGRATQLGMILGTAGYMSPEQARGKAVDKRADIWAFGVVLYELLTGRLAFAGETVSDTLAAVLKTDPDWGALPAGTPPPLRRLLQRCLERDPRRRYRDIGDVRADLELDTSPAEAPASGRRPARERRWQALAAVAALIAAAAVVVSVLWPSAPAAGPADARPFRFSFQLDGAQQIAIDMDQLLFDISNDGETVAWVGAAVPSGRQVFTRSLRDLAVRAVPNTQGAQNWCVQLSPDGRQVSFWRDDELLTAPLDGGSAPQRIYHGDRLWTWAWADDGSFVLAEAYGGLLRVKVPGAKPEVLTRLDPKADEVAHQFPQVLPGGRSLLFSAGRGYFYSTRLEALRLDGGTPQRKVVLEDAYGARYVSSGYLVYGRGDAICAAPFDPETLSVTGPETTLVTGVQTDDPQGVLTEFAVSLDGTLAYVPDQRLEEYRLGWADRGGGVTWLDVPGAPFDEPAISPDGSSVTVSARYKGDRSLQIYIIDLARPTPRRLTSNSGWNRRAVWSPDGRELVFSSTRDGHLNLYRTAADNPAASTRITTSPFDQTPMSWTRDGRLVFYERMQLDVRRIVTLSLAGAAPDPARVITPENVSESDAVLPPEGKWLAFVKLEGATSEVYVRALSPEGAAGAEQRVSTAGGLVPRWRPDGRELLYLSADARRILSVKAEASSQLRLGNETVAWAAPEGIELRAFDVAADGRLLIVAREKRTAPMEVVVSIGALPQPGKR
jgi:serine/threonine-protein kinase